LHYQRGLSKRLGYSDKHDISNCESKNVEPEKVLIKKCGAGEGFERPASINAQVAQAFETNSL